MQAVFVAHNHQRAVVHTYTTTSTPQTPVVSPYYVDGRNVSPVVWATVTS
jgi:hypothetical protein